MNLDILKKNLYTLGVPEILLPNTIHDLEYDNLFKKFIELMESNIINKISITKNKLPNNGILEKKIGSGMFNDTFKIKTDTCNKCILRITKIPSIDLHILFNSFYENIKHLILYIYLSKLYNNIKLIPKPYKIGFIKEQDEEEFNVFLIMEMGIITFDEYIDTVIFKDDLFYEDDLKQKIIKIYQILYLLNEGKDILEFKHNDLNSTNIIITENQELLLIDFGSTQFNIKINDESIPFISLINTNSPLYIGENRYFNIIHDMIVLLFSISVQTDVGNDIFELIDFGNDEDDATNIENKDIYTNCNTWILSKQNIKALLAHLFKYPGIPTKIKYGILTSNSFNLIELKDTLNKPIILPNYTKKTIEPSEFQKCINASKLPENSFYKKYLKYKLKYLNLTKHIK